MKSAVSPFPFAPHLACPPTVRRSTYRAVSWGRLGAAAGAGTAHVPPPPPPPPAVVPCRCVVFLCRAAAVGGDRWVRAAPLLRPRPAEKSLRRNRPYSRQPDPDSATSPRTSSNPSPSSQFRSQQPVPDPAASSKTQQPVPVPDPATSPSPRPSNQSQSVVSRLTSDG